MPKDAPDPFEIEMGLGIVVEKRPATSRWVTHIWKPVAVIPGAPEISEWKLLSGEGDIPRYHIATLTLNLHRTETEGYRVNLSNETPSVYVVLREGALEDPDAPEIEAICATVSPFEAQDYLDSGEDIVEPVAMSEGLIAWLQEFVNRHHVDTPFKKRKRNPHMTEETKFGKVLHPVEQRFYDKRKLN